MTKLFIENVNKEAPASIRIYPLDENSQVITPDSFTSMDDLGLSFGIALAPKTGIDCTGVVARSGGIILEGDGEFTVFGDDIDTTVASKAELFTNLVNAGYRVDVLPRWSGAQIVCNGGKVESGWYVLSNNAPFELSVDGEIIGSDFFFSSWGPKGKAFVKSELNKRGIDIEFGQELG